MCWDSQHFPEIQENLADHGITPNAELVAAAALLAGSGVSFQVRRGRSENTRRELRQVFNGRSATPDPNRDFDFVFTNATDQPISNVQVLMRAVDTTQVRTAHGLTVGVEKRSQRLIPMSIGPVGPGDTASRKVGSPTIAIAPMSPTGGDILRQLVHGRDPAIERLSTEPGRRYEIAGYSFTDADQNQAERRFPANGEPGFSRDTVNDQPVSITPHAFSRGIHL